MQDNVLVSVIVPVYNVEKYLEECVNSLTSQTYSNLEILLIDDGSTDGSGNICDSLAKEDARIRVFHLQNGGVSNARNFGIENAKGEYLSFVDSDDWVDLDMYEKMVQKIQLKSCEEVDAVFCMFAYEHFSGGGTSLIAKTSSV